MTDAAIDHSLEPVADALAREFGNIDPAVIDALVHEVAEEFRDAPVRDYIPLLTAHICRDRLRGGAD